MRAAVNDRILRSADNLDPLQVRNVDWRGNFNRKTGIGRASAAQHQINILVSLKLLSVEPGTNWPATTLLVSNGVLRGSEVLARRLVISTLMLSSAFCSLTTPFLELARYAAFEANEAESFESCSIHPRFTKISPIKSVFRKRVRPELKRKSRRTKPGSSTNFSHGGGRNLRLRTVFRPKSQQANHADDQRQYSTDKSERSE